MSRLLLLGIVCAALGAELQAASWTSAATGGAITATLSEPSPVVTPPALVVYLKNLSCERIGQEPDSTILADLRANGFRVVELNYAGHAKATTPFLNADVLKIRNEIGSGSFPGSTGLNAAKNQCYILCEGHRLLRNVPYFLNDPAVYSGTDSGAELRLDIAYPSRPSRPVPVVLGFSTSNSYADNEDDRMNNGNAFTGTHDTILEGAPAAGLAWAMADQPKYRAWGSPKLYSGFETNPDTIKKVRSAVRVLREAGAALCLSGNIAIHGFSRGATAGSLAAGDLAVPEIDTAGYSTALSSRVQAVLLGSGIYDYSRSGGTITGDPDGTQVDIYARFVSAWGPTASNLTLWQSQGAPYYMATSATAPVFLSYNTDDGTYYPYQAQLLAAKLATLGVPHQVITGSGGHKVTTTPSTLTAIYDFFKTHAQPTPNPPGPIQLGNYDATSQQLNLKLTANGNDASILYSFHTDGTPRKWVRTDGTVGTDPVWRTLADWGSPVRVGPLANLETVKFTALAYDPAKFTTALNSVNIAATAVAPPIVNMKAKPATGAIPLPSPDSGESATPASLGDTAHLSVTIYNDGTAVPDALITIRSGISSVGDPTPPSPKAFYQVVRP